MQIKIKRFDTTLPLPHYTTKGAACIDLYCRVETVVEPRTFGSIPLNIAVEIPEGYWIMIAFRSSGYKTGLIPANGIGICDWDYRGDNDEYKIPVYNVTDQPIVIEKGQRIAQLMAMPNERMELEEVEHLDHEDRGGFGSTGTH